MDTSLPHMEVDDNKLKLMRSLLVMCTLSSLLGSHSECGDRRMLEDLLSREVTAWLPQVGTEDYESLQDPHTEHGISWCGLTSEFVAAFPQVLPEGVERPNALERLQDQLRSQLRHNLDRMSQITDSPQEPPVQPIRQFVCDEFTWEMNVWLVLYSSAIVPFCGRSGSELWNLQNRDLGQLADFLGTAHLFSKPLTEKTLTATGLRDWVEKLEFVFCGPAEGLPSTPTPDLIYVVAVYRSKEKDKAYIKHLQSLPCLSTLGKSPSPDNGLWDYRAILEISRSSFTEDDLLVRKRRPLHFLPLYPGEEAIRRWKSILETSEKLVVHRCPRPLLRDNSESDNRDAFKEVELVQGSTTEGN
ncbi:hypothetical protein AYO21_10181 [Fonsecaea monophora]|uniref:Uncharacterized protein n=1 Tax=Fonsecaea monophora TaxID=254056 RepID=A0A177EW69_9EURO|nr:hypothetical protein AYO21_10181 [Fonsecaea monophora]OAG35641.1 hypothetical protein AYO21_10181 [Fonsecaea monophora]